MLIPSNRTKRECILSRLCFLVLSVWVFLPSAAQNNPYKIDDALYPIYQRASKQARQQEGLLVADTLYQQALKLGDKKAQCLAYIIPLQFYISQKDDSKIEKASTDLKEISRANNYLQYYYHAWSSEIIYFLNQQRSLLALQKAEKMKKQAFADRYPYGIFSCIRTMGHIYKSRGNFDLSAQYYQEALDYMLKNMPDQDPSQLYSSLAEYYRNTQKDYATALDYCEKALKSAKTERNTAQAMIEKCLVLFRQGRIDEFNDCYKEAVQMADRCKLSASVSLLIAHISKNILDKQYEQAHAHADQLSEEGLQQHAYIYECAKDYPNAIKYLKKYHQQLDSTNNLLQLSDIAELMITYPSTHGIFETEIVEICHIIHACGAQVYMDGANMNAQVGLTNPGFIGADVCHLNLHKTFASPHGGGGPGVGPICVAEHLVPFLPGHKLFGNAANQVSGAPFGSAGILPITYGYIRMMGTEGLTRATKIAILSANYLAASLKDTYGIVYRGATGFVGHEMILECRKVHEETGISENDIAKRLMDYGYHAPTLSFPVHGTLMIEPTESESLAELDNFVQVMLTIWDEIQEVKNGEADKTDNVLVNAPHPEYEVVADTWKHSYTRQKAAYPIESVRENKFWVNVARVDNTLGDRKLLPTCYGCFD